MPKPQLEFFDAVNAPRTCVGEEKQCVSVLLSAGSLLWQTVPTRGCREGRVEGSEKLTPSQYDSFTRVSRSLSQPMAAWSYMS